MLISKAEQLKTLQLTATYPAGIFPSFAVAHMSLYSWNLLWDTPKVLSESLLLTISTSGVGMTFDAFLGIVLFVDRFDGPAIHFVTATSWARHSSSCQAASITRWASSRALCTASSSCHCHTTTCAISIRATGSAQESHDMFHQWSSRVLAS